MVRRIGRQCGEDLLQIIGRLPTEAPSHSTRQIKINRALRTTMRGLRVREVLWAARKALHRNEILAADDPKVYTEERNFHGSEGDRRIHSAESA